MATSVNNIAHELKDIQAALMKLKASSNKDLDEKQMYISHLAISILQALRTNDNTVPH
jgi:hypothetical protein